MDQDPNAQESLSVPRMSERERATYAAQVKERRIALDLTQAELAESAGVSLGTITNIESGKKIPQGERIWRVMLVLGIAPTSSAEPEWVEEWIRVLVPLIKRLRPAVRGEVMGQVVLLLAQATQVSLPERPELSQHTKDLLAGKVEVPGHAGVSGATRHDMPTQQDMGLAAHHGGRMMSEEQRQQQDDEALNWDQGNSDEPA